MSASTLVRCATPGREARVAMQRPVGVGLYELWLEAPGLTEAQPGQFIHVRCGEGFLRRPFSVYRIEGHRIALLYQVKGMGTRWLAGLREGEGLDVLGPFGTPFTPPDPRERLLLVGGGVGIAPLALYAERHAGKLVGSAIVGFRTQELVAGLEAFQTSGISLKVYTEDGTTGSAGRVTDGLAERIRREGITRVLTCGPDPMMAAVAAIAVQSGAACEASVERPMGCGIGVCLGCVVPMRDGHFVRACKEGPVLDAAEVSW